MDDYIITFGDSTFGHAWKMTIDLKELAASAGVRKPLVKQGGQTYDEEVVSIPMPRAKKLLKLIRKYGAEEDFRKCDEYLKPNVRLHKYWRELCE
jgi:hypothetical protein